MPSWPRRLWQDLPEAERRDVRAFLRSLEARYGPFRDRLARAFAQLTVETWWTAQAASASAVAEGVKRRHGRGRRPSLQAFDRRLKRQGLGVEALDKMICRLEELASRNGREPSLHEYLQRRGAGAAGSATP